MENILKNLKESNQIECKLAKKSFPKEALYTYSSLCQYRWWCFNTWNRRARWKIYSFWCRKS